MQIEIGLPDISQNNSDSLNAPVNSGAVTLPLYNTIGFNINDYIIIGYPGTQTAQIAQVTAVSTNNLTIQVSGSSGLKYSVPQAFPVTTILTNQALIYNSQTSITGPFTRIGTVNLDPSKPATTFFYQSGAGQTTWSYYTQYFNSTTGFTSTQSPVITGTGYDFNSLFNLRKRFRNIFKDQTAVFISDSELNGYINEEYAVMQQIATQIDQEYALVMPSGNGSAFIANQQEYALPTNFKSIKYVLVSNGSQFYPATYMEIRDTFNIQNTPFAVNYQQTYGNFGYPSMFYYFDSNNIGFFPIPLIGSYKMWYYSTSIPLIQDSDIPTYPLNDYGYMIIDGTLIRAYEKSGKADLIRLERLDRKVENNRRRLRTELQQRQVQNAPSIGINDTRYLDPFAQDMSDSLDW